MTRHISQRTSNLRRSFVAALLAGLTLVAAAPAAIAQAYPNKPIKFIIASSPGGTVDTLGRRLGEQISKTLGQPVVVENMPAASAVIAARTVAKAPPDGYMVLIGTGTTHAANSAMVKNIGYDPIADFEPVTRLGYAALVISVNNALPITTVAELIAYAKANPGKLTFASGTGSARVSAEYFKKEAKIDMVSVPYKSNAAGMADVLGGHVSMIFGDTPLVLPQLRAGKVRGIAVTSSERSSLMPELPTISEAGLPGYELVGWVAAFLPANTPKPIVTQLNDAIQTAFRNKEFTDGLRAVGIEPAPTSPDQLRAYVASEIKKWGELVRGAGITPE